MCLAMSRVASYLFGSWSLLEVSLLNVMLSPANRHYRCLLLYDRRFNISVCHVCILVMTDNAMRIKLKCKIYNIIVKPAIIYGYENWAVKKNDRQKPRTRMLIWARGKSKKDHIKNEDIWRRRQT